MWDRMWMNSRCHGDWLHRFLPLAEYQDGTLEICEICKMELFSPVRNGRIDNYRYVTYHARDLLAPWMGEYYHEYKYGQ